MNKKLIGKKFSKLTILSEAPPYIYQEKYSIPKVKVICSCGKTLDVRIESLTSGRTKSCGCLKKDPRYNTLKALKKMNFDKAFIAFHETKGLYYCNNQAAFAKGFGLSPSGISSCLSGKSQHIGDWNIKRPSEEIKLTVNLELCKANQAYVHINDEQQVIEQSMSFITNSLWS